MECLSWRHTCCLPLYFVIAGSTVVTPADTSAGEAGADRGPGLAKEQEQGQEAEGEAGGLHDAGLLLVGTPGFLELLLGTLLVTRWTDRKTLGIFSHKVDR